ncbi:MAG: ATPase, T2SS/T4P/T4SS family [Planctomycetota bacterium]
MKAVFKRSSDNHWYLTVLVMTVGFAALCQTACAQFGLAEQAAVQDIQNEAGGNKTRGGRNPAAQQPQNQAAQPAAQPEGEDAAESAAPAEPAIDLDKWNDEHSILRQDEFAISWAKLIPIVLVLLAWVRSVDWVNRDAQIFGLKHTTWNTVMVVPFVLAFLLMLLIPNYVLGLVVLTLAWLAPFIAYVVYHNKSVEKHQTVFTPGWFRHQLAVGLKMVGIKIADEPRADYMKGPDVELDARGGDNTEDQANLLTARQSPGYVHVKELIADMVARGSSRALMDYTSDAVSVRYMIDGVWHPGDPRDRESGDVMLAVMKTLTNLNVSERKKKQEGIFGAKYQKKQYVAEVVSQGVKTGERVVVSLRGKGLDAGYETLESLGMREKLREQWLQIMNSDEGLVVISAMPEGGLTTLTDISLFETDRLMRDFMSVEDIVEPETDIENIPAHYYDSAKNQSPAEIIPSLSRKYPNVWVMRDFVDPESAKLMMQEVDLERLVVTTVHAQDAAEACLRMLKKKTPHKEFAQGLIGVINTRLIRKLCGECKVGYEATPALMKKLGIPPGKVTQFYRTPKPEEIEKPCKACAGIGFRGRTGLFELLEVDDQFRHTLMKQPKIDALRKSARQAGMRTLQEEGILLVAKGVTSLPELSRVLKG